MQLVVDHHPFPDEVGLLDGKHQLIDGRPDRLERRLQVGGRTMKHRVVREVHLERPRRLDHGAQQLLHLLRREDLFEFRARLGQLTAPG